MQSSFRWHLLSLEEIFFKIINLMFTYHTAIGADSKKDIIQFFQRVRNLNSADM